ncbi:glycosyltransferase family 2 protein [Patescibacteria group bacterium]|nr:glycosyltransferase family 2 protein [Patescibacteria group bacterium]MCL5409226.1 glycosyltransferase family 2 protein [Patescibacteria group bacterium]
MAELTVVILNYQTPQLTIKCLESIFNQRWHNKIKVVVVDNASADNSIEQIQNRYPQLEIIHSKANLGFAGGNNLALSKLKTNWILLLNSDTEVEKDSLDQLIIGAEEANFDIASCLLVNTHHKLQPNFGSLPSFIAVLVWLTGADDLLGRWLNLPSYHQEILDAYQQTQQVGWVSGTAMLINRKVIEKIGLLDDQIFMYGEDVDYCLRANRAGFRVGWVKDAKIMHLGGGSSYQPQYSQWLGEFNGLIYIYQKYYGQVIASCLKLWIYFFVLLRILAFSVTLNFKFAKTYCKVLVNL